MIAVEYTRHIKKNKQTEQPTYFHPSFPPQMKSEAMFEHEYLIQQQQQLVFHKVYRITLLW